MSIIVHGVYHIKDQFFIDYPDPYLKSNKGEKRPHYFCYKDPITGLMWMIPFTSQQSKIDDYNRRLASGKKVDIFHPTELDGRKGMLLIADMFPVIEDYIESAYEISGIPVIYKDISEIKAIERKAKKILVLLRKGVKFTSTQPDIFSIERSLLS